MRPSLRLAACCFTLALATSAAAQDTFLAHVDGRHVGTWTTVTDAAGYRETLRIVALVQDRRRATVLESFSLMPAADGWQWVRRVRAGADTRTEDGRLAGGTLWRGEGAGREALATVPAGTVLPSMRAERIRAFAGEATPADEFPYLDPSRLRVVPARLRPCAVDATLPLATRCVELDLDARSGDERWQLAADGHALRVDATFAGLPLRLERCTHKCSRPVARPFDMLDALVVASPYRLTKRTAQKKLRYILVRDDGQPPQLVATGEQKVALDGARAVVTVCTDCGDATAETAASLAPYLQPNAWVRSDDARIRELAQRADRVDRPLAARMDRLANVVQSRMRNEPDFLGYGDAVQALRTGRGDCTEFAVLLAALARAQGIPARVAVGMAYSSRFTGRRDTFNPHMWVQVYDGERWVSHDAALEGFDSAHIALAVGTGEPQEAFDAYLQLRRLRIERLGAVVR
jgi:hypothetical protein